MMFKSVTDGVKKGISKGNPAIKLFPYLSTLIQEPSPEASKQSFKKMKR